MKHYILLLLCCQVYFSTAQEVKNPSNIPSKKLIDADLKDVNFGIKIATPLDSLSKIEDYTVEAHLLKAIVVDSIEIEVNTLFAGELDSAKIQGVVSKKFNDKLSLGGRVSTNFSSIDYVDHEIYARIHNVFKIQKWVIDFESLIDTKEQKFAGLGAIAENGRVSVGFGMSLDHAFVVARYSLF